MKINDLMFGDCFEIIPNLNGKFDLLLTDPPYAMPATYYQSRKTQKRWSDVSIMQTWFRYFVHQVSPKMKPDCVVVVFCSLDSLVAFYPSIYESFKVCTSAVWRKQNFGMGSLVRNQHEFLIIGKNGKPFIGSRGFSSVINCDVVPHAKRQHLAQKPYGLIRAIVEQFCPIGGRILDPFAGSNVVGQVAKDTSRDSISIEFQQPQQREAGHQGAADGLSNFERDVQKLVNERWDGT